MSATILAIDPGTEKSGVVEYLPGERKIRACVLDNRELLARIRCSELPLDVMAIEQIRSYGMAIGATTLDTVEWSGRFIEAFLHRDPVDDESRVLRLPRLEIKVHLCGTAKAKDANIRQALIDRLGPPGTKTSPGATYGIKTHMWSALAVAVTAYDKLENPHE